MQAFFFVLVTLGRMGDDAAVARFQMPAPFAFAVFVIVVGHESEFFRLVDKHPWR